MKRSKARHESTQPPQIKGTRSPLHKTYFQPKAPYPLRNTRHVELTIAATAAALVAAVVAAAITLIALSKSSALTARQREASSALVSAEAAVNRSLLGVDLLLTQAEQLVALIRSQSADDDARRNQVLASLATQNLLVQHVSILSADGDVLMTSDGSAKRLGVELPAAFLAEVAGSAVPTLTVSPPISSFARAERVLFFARAVPLAAGGTGIAVAEVGVSRLVASTVRGIAPDAFEITFERGNGELLASHPARDALIGTQLQPALGSSNFKELDALDLQSRVTNVPAIVVAGPTLYPNLVITASIPLETALADWKNLRRGILIGAAAFIAFIVGIAVMMRAYVLKLRRAQSQIARAKVTVDQALESMVDGFLLLDNDGRVVTWNPQFLEFHPWLAASMEKDESYATIVGRAGGHPLFAPALSAKSQLIGTSPGEALLTASETEQPFPDGRIVRISERSTPDGGRVSTFTDITESKLQQRELSASKSEMRATLDAIPDLLYEVGLDGRYYSYHSPRTEVSATPSIEVVGKLVRDVLPPAAAATVMAALAEANSDRMSFGKQFELPRAKGSRWFELSVCKKATPSDGQPVFIVISRDITASRTAAAEIEALAFYDPLTNLPNRRLLMDRLKQSIASSAFSGRPAALVFIDLDHFKTLNDSMRHEVGDKLLIQAAERLLTAVKPGDTVARLGGDEFVVLLENIGNDTAAAQSGATVVAENIRVLLGHAYMLDALEYACTASLGITLINGDGSPADELLKQADIAMYQAKAAGRNAFRFYSAYMEDAIQSRALLEQELHAAAGLNQFALHYQQQVNADNIVVGAEALIRWNHPERGIVLPDKFIPFAEETGLITQIGAWVVENACEQLGRWATDSETAHLSLSLNVSAQQFRQPTFVATVRMALARHAVDPERLMLEITESVMLDDVDASIAKMDELVRIGVRFSLDDFGTGHSSLSYLTRLPISQLKIAQPFIDNIGTNASDAVVIQTIVGMARNLGLEVIAEGVETQAQRDFLAAHGCNLCQGFLFGRAVSAAAFRASIDAPVIA